MPELIGYLISALVGISLGLIGGGASILMVPIIVYVFALNPVMATSYSLFVVGSTSPIGSFNCYRRGLVSVRTALLFGLTSITNVFITRKFLLPNIPEVVVSIGDFPIRKDMTIMVLFAVLMLMLMASLRMIRKRNEIVSIDGTAGNSALKIFIYGVLIGLVTGFLGAGGGFLIIPALVLFLNLSMKTAVGTSLLIIALNSLIGFTGDLGHIDINWKFLGIISGITITVIFIGGAMAKKIAGEKLKKGFWMVCTNHGYLHYH